MKKHANEKNANDAGRIMMPVMLVLLLALVVLLGMLSSCAAVTVDEGNPSASSPYICDVDFRGEPCVFACTDCKSQLDCEGAVVTAVDECLSQRSCHSIRGYFSDPACSEPVEFNSCNPPEYVWAIEDFKCAQVSLW